MNYIVAMLTILVLNIYYCSENSILLKDMAVPFVIEAVLCSLIFYFKRDSEPKTDIADEWFVNDELGNSFRYYAEKYPYEDKDLIITDEDISIHRKKKDGSTLNIKFLSNKKVELTVKYPNSKLSMTIHIDSLKSMQDLIEDFYKEENNETA